jgi:Asp-tRNA(Asn)/Glu-tRNA(Gln) amidotransferase A subunit family amidase
MERRSLLQLTPAAAVLLLSEVGVEAQGRRTPRNLPSREALREALGLAGLSFRDEQLDQMRGAVARSGASFAGLREQRVPADTDPAFHFEALLPGMAVPPAAPFVPPPARPARRFQRLEEVAYWPIPDLAALLRRRRVTATALTRMYLERLRKHDDALHCVITLTEERALEQAARADEELRRGRYRGLLHGIPYGAKDLFATDGIRTTWGAEPYKDQVLAGNATVIEKLEKAGAVLVAKLSMGALALGGQWFGGMTRNPWNPEKTSSGSSAGSAAATAAGLVPFSIGTETLGSILTPSRICGVTGLRPTFGRVSRAGAMSLCWTMDKVGPICRTAEDAMVVLRAMEGPDGKDATVAARPLAWNGAARVQGLRVGVVRADFERLGPERKVVAEAALAVLEKAGLRLQPMELPAMAAGPLLTILNAEAAAAFDDLTRDGGVDLLSGQKDGDWPNTFRAARLIPAVEYLRAMRARTLLMREMQALMANWDVLVTPSSSQLLTITNLTGHPQMTVPAGLLNGEPEAIHFTGRLFEEGKMARVAKAYQDGTRWHQQAPGGFPA